MGALASGQQPRPSRPTADQQARRTITISDYLIMTSSPLDIAIYFFICRQFLFTKKAIPFGREDARLLDPELSVGGYDRAIERLVAKGALKRVEVAGSLKNCFMPAWVTPTQIVPWGTSSATRFDRPQGCTYTPIERHLIDLYLGSYTPKVSGRSEVMRYTKKPLLSLRDVGVYIINRHHARKGLPVYIPRPYRSTYDLSRLVRAGLCNEQGHFFPVPSLQAVLTAVSQCAFGLDTDAPQLTPIGWSALGITQTHALSEPLSPLEMARLSTAGNAPLFFVPPGMIDFDSIAGSKALIDSPYVDHGLNGASESHEKSGQAFTDQPTCRHDYSRNPNEQTNPSAADAASAGAEVPVEIYRLYRGLNRKRAIPATEWESLTLMAEISGGWSNIRSILIAAAARRAGPPTILTPRYIASSLAQQAASEDSDVPDISDIEDASAASPASSADDELWRLLTGMSQRAKLIREGKATLERVQGWVAVMDLMEQHGMQFSSRPGWLYHQLDAGNEPWTSEQAIKVAKKDKARRDDEERHAAQRECERQEEEQRQQEADQTRKNDLLLYDAWRVSMREHPENERVVISALQRLYGVQSVQFDDEKIVLVVETPPSSSDLMRLYKGAHYLLGLTSIVEIEVRQTASPTASPAICAHPCERPAPRPMPTGTGEQAKPIEARLEPPSWIILPERWDVLPKTLRLLLVGAHYDAITNMLVVPTAFHARKVNEQWTSWAEVCPADVRVISRDEVTKEVNETVSSSGYDNPEGTLAHEIGSNPATFASEDISTKDQSSPNHVLTAQDATTALNDIIMYNRKLSHLTGKLQITEWEPPKGIVTVQVDGLEAFLRVQQERSWFCRELAALAGAGQPAIPVTFQNVNH